MGSRSHEEKVGKVSRRCCLILLNVSRFCSRKKARCMLCALARTFLVKKTKAFHIKIRKPRVGIGSDYISRACSFDDWTRNVCVVLFTDAKTVFFFFFANHGQYYRLPNLKQKKKNNYFYEIAKLGKENVLIKVTIEEGGRGRGAGGEKDVEKFVV